jgi:hypothetical protein
MENPETQEAREPSPETQTSFEAQPTGSIKTDVLEMSDDQLRKAISMVLISAGYSKEE